MQMRGPLLPSFKETFSVSESFLGLVAPAGSISFLVSILFFGMKTGEINIKKYLWIGIGVNSIFVFLIGSSPTFFILLGFFFGGGVAAGVRVGLSRPVLSHLFPNRRGWIFNLYDLAWAVGAFLGPLYVTLITAFGSWRFSYIILAFAFIPIVITLQRKDMPSVVGKEQPIALRNLREMLKKPAMIGMILIIFTSAGVEGGFFTWLPYYLNQFFSQKTANLALSGYLAAYIPGRLFHSWISEKTDYLRLILLDSLISVPFLIYTFFIADGYSMLASIFMVGFLVSGIFPTILAFGTDISPEHSGPVNALAMSSSTLGISTFSITIGVIADLFSIEPAMKILVILMGGVAATSYLTQIISRK